MSAASEPPKPRFTALHMSDTHRTKDEPLSTDEILHSLRADLERHGDDGLRPPDLVLLSGDVVQSAEQREYREAAQFLRALMDHLKLPMSRLVLVPGNHDVHWPTSEMQFTLRREKPAGTDNDLIIGYHDRFMCGASWDAYQQRFAHFAEFYKGLFGVDYPLNKGEQYTVHRFEDLGAAVVGFSSCHTNDHERKGGRICHNTIARAAEEISDFPGLRIAVWHHDYNWRGSTTPDYLSIDSLRQVAERAFHIGFCGHTHRSAFNNVRQLDGIAMPLVATGSLCAGARERPESVPRLYHVLDFYDDFVRVHPRTKEELSSPWRGSAAFRDEAGRYVPWRDLPFAKRPATPMPRSVPPFPAPGVARASSPFVEQNARQLPRERVLSHYIWTPASDAIDSGQSQIVLGVRGSGKTALLLSLTLAGRRYSPKFTHDVTAALSRIGLMCPMKVDDTTTLNGKGWIPHEERAQLFSALVATMWAAEMVATLEELRVWGQTTGFVVGEEEQIARLLIESWCGGVDPLPTFSSLRRWIRSTIRGTIAAAASEPDEQARRSFLRELLAHPLARGGSRALHDTATNLRQLPVLANTSWALLFDEVEVLTEWQQEVVYDVLGKSTELVTIKIATLPYAHARALAMCKLPLVEGHDYTELPLSLTANLELELDSSEGSSTEFEKVASGMFRARVDRLGKAHLTLADVWPDPGYTTVLADVHPSLPSTREALEAELLKSLNEKTAERARELRAADPGKFADQYFRRYQQPLRFRIARQAQQAGIDIPLYWGASALLRACDGNCRRLLRLLDECWRKYWSTDGIRPLTPNEQDKAVRDWADSIARSSPAATESGRALKEIVDRIAASHDARLHERRFLSKETLTVQLTRFSNEQATAIAVGIAYGYLVPRLENASDFETMKYPREEVELRLGFPIAASKRQPLRTGATATIADLRQVVFPWWREG